MMAPSMAHVKILWSGSSVESLSNTRRIAYHFRRCQSRSPHTTTVVSWRRSSQTVEASSSRAKSSAGTARPMWHWVEPSCLMIGSFPSGNQSDCLVREPSASGRMFGDDIVHLRRVERHVPRPLAEATSRIDGAHPFVKSFALGFVLLAVRPLDFQRKCFPVR